MNTLMPNGRTNILEIPKHFGTVASVVDPQDADIYWLACQICQTPMAVICWFEAGQRVSETAAEVAEREWLQEMARHPEVPAVAEVFVIQDTQTDERFAAGVGDGGHPAIRFFAGAPLVGEHGKVLGVLGVKDHEPRDLTPEQKLGLQALGRQVIARRQWERSREQLEQTTTERQQAVAGLEWERTLLRALMDNSGDCIYFKDRESRFLRCSHQNARRFQEQHITDLIGKRDSDFFAEEHAQAALADEQRIIQTGEPMTGKVEKETWPDGSTTWALTSKMPLRSEAGEIIGTFGISKDITEMKHAEEKLARIHKQLLDASRQAGMAEIASNVLHNVGNVLNSVNVSSSLIADKLRGSKVTGLARVAALLQSHEADLAAFFTTDAKGRQLPGYLAALAAHIAQEQAELLQEVGSLVSNVVHIKEIVAMQQGYAKSSGVLELLPITDLVEDALRINDGAMIRHKVKVVREFNEAPPILTEKHKVLQILVNLIRNAKHACDDAGREDKQIVLRVSHAEGRVRVSVSDNGIGVPAENLNRIFNHGFTTRKDGHGFGLHSGALAAKELNGSLTVTSAGPGCGATFTLELPIRGRAASA